ncbi:MAG: hypothetical protein ACI8XM_001646 [Haloarculaceae archaeon]
MFPEVVSGLPSWLVVGVLLGVVGSLLVGAAFLLGERLIPGEQPTYRQRQQQRQSGESRRRGEFRAYLETIDEHYAEDYALDGGRVAFYLPARDVAITFDPRTHYQIDRTETDSVLAEHEMPGAMLGDRLPFETPTVEFVNGGKKVTDARTAFAELGVSADASSDEIRRAYRRKLKEVHPDQGGDEDDFKRVREAYTVAKEHAD